MIGTNLAITTKNYAVGITYDADALAFFTAASITDTTQKNAVNQLVLDLKAASIWTKFKALYPVVGGVASSHAVNLKQPGTYNLTFSVGWTHSSTGITPLNAYANTGLNASTNLTLNSNHLSVYTRTNQVINSVPIGAFNSITSQIFQLNVSTGTGYYFYTGNTTTEVTSSIADSKGLFMGSQRAIADRKIFRNGSTLASLATSINTNNPSLSIYLGARNQDNGANTYTTQQIAFASIGDGLTDTDAINFYNAVQTYQTTLSRQV